MWNFKGRFRTTVGLTSEDFQWVCKKDHRLQNVILKLTSEKDHWLFKGGFSNERLEGPLAPQTELFEGQTRILK